MAAPRSESVMRGNHPAGRDRRTCDSRRRRPILEFLTCMPGFTRIVIAVGLLACFGLDRLWASTPVVSDKLTVHRSARAVHRRFTVHPSDAIVASDQSQQFVVTDAQGKFVAVRWNVSGLGCSGLACGTINEQGVYRTPSSLPEPRIVTLEGVLVSDPNYSVLTQIQLAPTVAVAVSPSSAPVSTPEMEPLTGSAVGKPTSARSAILPPSPVVIAAAPSVEGRIVPRTPWLLASPDAVAAAPVVGRQFAARIASLPPTNVIAAPPAVERTMVERKSPLPPLPVVIAAAPSVERGIVPRTPWMLASPAAVAAAPVVGGQFAARSASLPPTNVIAAPPAVERTMVDRKSPLPPLPVVIAAAPSIERGIVPRTPWMLASPDAVAAAPVVGGQFAARTASLPATSVIAAPPAVERTMVERKSPLPPLPVAIAAAPSVERGGVPRTPWMLASPDAVAAAPVVGGQFRTRSASLPPTNVIAAPPAVERAMVDRNSPLPPLRVGVNAGPAASQVATKKTQPLTPMVGGQSVAGSTLLPLPDDADAIPAPAAASSEHPPLVTYRDGQLTINAQNSTLVEVLKLVAEKTGAVIDVPPGTGLERIVEHTGPGQPDDVLAQLLNGSSYDFIIVSSPQSPHAPAQVLLSLRRTDAPPGVQPEELKTATSSPLWTPPEVAPAAAILSLPIDPATLPPKEALTPEVLGKMMRERAEQIRVQTQSQ
jgi:hypothetical protein